MATAIVEGHVPMTDQARNAGLDADVAQAYVIFDGCPKLCTHFGNGKSATELAVKIAASGIDTELCLKGINGITCPYGQHQAQVLMALRVIIRQ